MLTLILPPDISEKIAVALRKAGDREVGGVLMAEHTGLNEFEVKDIAIHRRGAIASFVRRIEEAIGRLRAFFESTNHDYTRFNYIGEWHSHPCFEPEPSPRDDASMKQIVQDPEVGANFVVLLIVKLDSIGTLIARAHMYLPNGEKHRSIVRSEVLQS